MNSLQCDKKLSVPEGVIDVVLDTDAFNEIDDQYAISYMVNSTEKLNVQAIYAAPFYNENSLSPGDGMEKSYCEIKKLLKLMKKEDMIKNVYKGANRYMTDESIPVKSEATEHLIELALKHTSEKPLYVVGIAAITNIASAILLKPEIKERIVVVWLGGHSREYRDTAEYNMIQDIAAARVVFASGVPLVQLPCCGVVSNFSISRPELEYWLKGKNALCDYLVQNSIDAMEGWPESKRDWTRVIWDVTAIGWLLNDNGRFMEDRITEVKLPTHDYRYSDKHTGKFMKYVYYIKRDPLMWDMIKKITQKEIEENEKI